jgi:hypothetical protein
VWGLRAGCLEQNPTPRRRASNIRSPNQREGSGFDRENKTVHHTAGFTFFRDIANAMPIPRFIQKSCLAFQTACIRCRFGKCRIGRVTRMNLSQYIPAPFTVPYAPQSLLRRYHAGLFYEMTLIARFFVGWRERQSSPREGRSVGTLIQRKPGV